MDKVIGISSLLLLIALILRNWALMIRIAELDERIDALQEWIEFLHGINFDKMTKAVREWERSE